MYRVAIDRARAALAVAMLAALAAAPAASAASADKAALRNVVGTLEAKTAYIQQFSLELSEDLELTEAACGKARLGRLDPDEAAETHALLNRAITLAEDGLKRDFEPAFASDGDYAHIEKQLDALADRTSGLRRHNLRKAAIYLESARLERNRQAHYIHGALNAQKGLDCHPRDLLNAIDTMVGGAKKDEQFTLGTLYTAVRSPTTVIRKSRPLQFKISVTYTVSYANAETLPLGGSDARCQTNGTEIGTMTQTATFPPITVLPSGQLKAVIEANGTGQITGTWSASGNFFPGNDCGAGSQTYACGGAIVRAPTSVSVPYIALHPSGTLADLNVTLPTVGEDTMDGCPDGSDQSAYIPIGQGFGALAAHGEEFHLPLDGLALRQRFDTATIEQGIEHLGPTLPPANCIGDQDYLSACSNGGSRVHDVVKVEPVSSD
jgi:hypothetical protein